MSTLYDEVLKNLSWYELNSDFKDPMYQYMKKLSTQTYQKDVYPLSITDYTTHDDFIIYRKNQTLRFGSYQCFASTGKEAYMDSLFSCILFQLPFFLESFQIGWIGFAFVIPILIISIFGGIKESYRWFILNQAIWDAFICYDFICSKPTLLGWSILDKYPKQNTCFYRNLTANNEIVYLGYEVFRMFLRNASFIPVFHLSLSRFLAMYFPGFYKKFTKNGYKIIIFILFFNVLCLSIFVVSSTNFATLALVISLDNTKCTPFCQAPLNIIYCHENIPKYFQCMNEVRLTLNNASKEQQKFAKIFKYLTYSIPPTMFFLSIICASFLFYKIASQLKFQLKTNPDSFKQTIKISSVVGFQCLTMSVIFVITCLQKYMRIKSEVSGTLQVYDNLPPWFLLLQYYTTTASLNMIRVLLDSCIILVVLSGYSRCVIATFKCLWLCLINPRQAFQKIRYNSTEVTVIASSRK